MAAAAHPNPADMEATEGARDQLLPRIEPAGVAWPERGGKTGVRFKLFSLGAIEALLGPAALTGAAVGFWITLNERDGEVGTSGELLVGDGVEAEGAGTAMGSGTACG